MNILIKNGLDFSSCSFPDFSVFYFLAEKPSAPSTKLDKKLFFLLPAIKDQQKQASV